MRYAVQWLRSVVFIGQMYVAMLVVGVVYLPYALITRDGALRACQDYCRYVCWSAAWMVGLRTEVRGEVPSGGVLIAAKHQSFLDILMIFGALPRGRFIMKKQLVWAPVLGWYGLRIGCVPVDRGKRGQAIRAMVARVKSGVQKPGQLIIYPQGTRVAPGVAKPYKAGTAALYQELGQACVPVATNVGMFWPRHSLYRKQGVAVVEFLPTIPAGKEPRVFLAELEQVVEAASDKLMAEARAAEAQSSK
ncbi:MAG: 1-acyl-sn-glycerol-3-phosphate acyltransferase [Rhodobacteraceae bacterium]|nr:MAG: 1-acyl-sn-glycerol-3-phosphate acyltransferase [Paracoccaceae bacterium]